jgi:hypothetical protein
MNSLRPPSSYFGHQPGPIWARASILCFPAWNGRCFVLINHLVGTGHCPIKILGMLNRFGLGLGRFSRCITSDERMLAGFFIFSSQFSARLTQQSKVRMHSASIYTATCIRCFIRSAARNVEMMLVDDRQGCVVVFTIFCMQVQLAVMLKVVIVVESSRTWFLYFYHET